MSTAISQLVANFGYFFVFIVLFSKRKFVKQLLQKEKLKISEEIVLTLIFGAIGIFSTYNGFIFEGAIGNTRNMAVVFSGMLCGPFVGIGAGLIAGIHRFFVGGISAIPCGLATIIGGFLTAYLYKATDIEKRWLYALAVAMVIESMSFGLIFLISKPYETAILIIRTLFGPMVLVNGIGSAILMLLTENIFKEKEQIAASQSKLALEIADRTLPYFKNSDKVSLEQICNIVKESVGADAVVISNNNKIISFSNDLEFNTSEIGPYIVENLSSLVKKSDLVEIGKKSNQVLFNNIIYKSAISAPLKEGNEIIGLLTLFYYNRNAFTYDEKVLLKSLSKLMSTQLELVKIENLKEMATQAEIKALQARINPHFLFNVLNTIVSFIRINPDKARELIINLSDYLRYTTESKPELIDIKEEIKHVKSYIQIEQARFKDKIKINYNIDENIDIKVPMLTIQPLVENAIKHGMNGKENEIVISVDVYKKENNVTVIIEDNGKGIDKEIIDKIYKNTIENSKVGLINVHKRLKLLYGSGIIIERIDKGTRIKFTINIEKSNKILKGNKVERILS